MTSEIERQELLLAFFKTLAHMDRLRIVGVLTSQPGNAAQIAEKLALPPYEVLRHLEQLEALGLVTAMEGETIPRSEASVIPNIPRTGRESPTVYALSKNGVEDLARKALAGLRPTARPDDFEGEAYERKVLADYLRADGTLKSIPVQEKKKMVILRHLVEKFEPGRRYTEKEVTALLKPVNEDYAALRRYMVDSGLLGRESGMYWRVANN
jgi:hypothetical protein